MEARAAPRRAEEGRQARTHRLAARAATKARAKAQQTARGRGAEDGGCARVQRCLMLTMSGHGADDASRAFRQIVRVQQQTSTWRRALRACLRVRESIREPCEHSASGPPCEAEAVVEVILP